MFSVFISPSIRLLGRAIPKDVQFSQVFRGKLHSGLFALLAVVIFSLTVPMTQLALKGFSPEFITFTRAVLAGLASVITVIFMGWRLPQKKHFLPLTMGGACITLLFPYCLSVSLNNLSASNMGVVLAAIPLLTACLATVLFKEKQNTLFWFSIVLGTGFLMLFFYQAQGLGVSWTVFIMLLAAALGYSLGGFVAKSLGGFQTICWMCILYLPFSLFAWGHEAASNVHTFNNWPLYWDSVLALLYVAILSQWLGFYFWYGAMANIGIAKAGQVQLLQPFFTLFFSVLLLGAALEAIHLAYAGLISLSVILCMKSR